MPAVDARCGCLGGAGLPGSVGSANLEPRRPATGQPGPRERSRREGSRPMRLLKAEDHARMPWKNGGGETVEVAVHPAVPGLDGFDWRVSMATVAADGPFSCFPGIDRTLAVLDGAGLELSVEGQGAHRLTPETAPLAFPGDVPAFARLVGGPVTDLNVMTRRRACRQRVTRLRGTHPSTALRGRWIVLVAAGPSLVGVDGRGSAAPTRRRAAGRGRCRGRRGRRSGRSLRGGDRSPLTRVTAAPRRGPGPGPRRGASGGRPAPRSSSGNRGSRPGSRARAAAGAGRRGRPACPSRAPAR